MNAEVGADGTINDSHTLYCLEGNSVIVSANSPDGTRLSSSVDCSVNLGQAWTRVCSSYTPPGNANLNLGRWDCVWDTGTQPATFTELATVCTQANGTLSTFDDLVGAFFTHCRFS